MAAIVLLCGVGSAQPGSGTIPKMSIPMSRRAFLAAAAAAPAVSQSPMPNNKLGLDLFSLRSQGWSAFEMLDFCAEHGAQIAHFSEPRFLGSLEPENLDNVRAKADELGLALEVGFGSICPTSSRFDLAQGSAPEQLRRMIGVAQTLGSPLVRCYLGSANDRTGEITLAEHIANTVETLRAVRDDALEAGVKIAVENHAGDLQALQLRELIESAGTDHVGALLDAGNAAWTLEDPHHTLEVLAPVALTTGVRDSRIWLTEEGANVMWVPLGEGNVDIRRWRARLRELRPDLPFSLEIINVRSPRSFAFRQPEFWEAYRDVPAWVFMTFERLAATGEPYEAPQPPADPDEDREAYRAWAAKQERDDVARDLRFCRDELGLGTEDAV